MDGPTRLVRVGTVARIVLLSLGSLALGAGLGVTASFYHSAVFPFGLVAVFLAMAGGLVGLRVLLRARYPAALASVGLVAVMTVLAGADGRDSVMIAANPAGFALLIGVAILLVFANAWPGILPASPVKLEPRA